MFPMLIYYVDVFTMLVFPIHPKHPLRRYWETPKRLPKKTLEKTPGMTGGFCGEGTTYPAILLVTFLGWLSDPFNGSVTSNEGIQISL